MARETRTYPETRDSWLRLIPALTANAADLPHLEDLRLQLESVAVQVGDLLAQQATLTASKQDVSKRLQALIAEGRQLAAFLRAGVKQRYGTRSEKLAAFHLQPFRGRKVVGAEEKSKKKRQADTPAASTSETPE
jgi:hypothetical protein